MRWMNILVCLSCSYPLLILLFAGFKETAFLYAVSSAALTHSLARACSAGRMERCTCDDSPDLENRKAWQWGVCGDNLKYSTKFLKKFLGQKRIGKDLRAKVDIHNTNVGIKVRSCTSRPSMRIGLVASLLPHPQPRLFVRGLFTAPTHKPDLFTCVLWTVLRTPWRGTWTLV